MYKNVFIGVLILLIGILVGRSTVSQQNDKIAYDAMKCLQIVYLYDTNFFYDVIVENDNYENLKEHLGEEQFMPYWHINP